MISNVFSRLSKDGLRKTLQFYGKAYAWRMSLNYRQNQARFKAYSLPVFTLYVLFDYLRRQTDYLIGGIEYFLIGRNGIPRNTLDEYTIRLIRSSWLNEHSIVYAFGVSRHIETEEELAAKIRCKVLLFDPTPPAIEYMKSKEFDPNLIFTPIGVWTTSGPMKFYTDKRDWVKNLSVVNFYHNSAYIEAQCYTLEDIMRERGHDHIDLLKMDIEGSAVHVLTHMLEHTQIRPPQIVGALETPMLTVGATLSEIVRVIRQKARLYSLLEKAGYRIITHNVAEFTAIRES